IPSKSSFPLYCVYLVFCCYAFLKTKIGIRFFGYKKKTDLIRFLGCQKRCRKRKVRAGAILVPKNVSCVLSEISTKLEENYRKIVSDFSKNSYARRKVFLQLSTSSPLPFPHPSKDEAY